MFNCNKKKKKKLPSNYTLQRGLANSFIEKNVSPSSKTSWTK